MKRNDFAESMIGRTGQRQLSHVQQVFLIASWAGQPCASVRPLPVCLLSPPSARSFEFYC